jgi:hypothetical protein
VVAEDKDNGLDRVRAIAFPWVSLVPTIPECYWDTEKAIGRAEDLLAFILRRVIGPTEELQVYVILDGEPDDGNGKRRFYSNDRVYFEVDLRSLEEKEGDDTRWRRTRHVSIFIDSCKKDWERAFKPYPWERQWQRQIGVLSWKKVY